jgi:SAM-dependent methyltransferase
MAGMDAIIAALKQLLRRSKLYRYWQTAETIDPGSAEGAILLGNFVSALRAKRLADVLELGTLRSIPDRPTHHREWCSHDARFVMSDFVPGLDVDVVADIHSLDSVFGSQSFDFVIACSVFEHVQRPWIAAQRIANVLRPDGQVFIQTHQSFPIHGFPSDYWRFTQEALRTLFADAGLIILATWYDFPAQILSKRIPGTKNHPAFLNVCITAQKPANGTTT